MGWLLWKEQKQQVQALALCRPGGQYMEAPSSLPLSTHGVNAALEEGVAGHTPVRTFCGQDLFNWAKKLYLKGEGAVEGRRALSQPWAFHKEERTGPLMPVNNQ